MQSDLTTTLNEVDQAREGWLSLTRELSHDQANWRPAHDRWSIAQCMDHLNVATGKLLTRIDTAIGQARAKHVESQGPFAYGFVARWFLRSLAPDGARRLPAPPVYRPSMSTLDLQAVTGRFEQVAADLARCVVAADGLDLARVRVGSPALPIFRLPLGIWFLSTSSHMLRHLNQARRVRKDERFPSGSHPETSNSGTRDHRSQR